MQFDSIFGLLGLVGFFGGVGGVAVSVRTLDFMNIIPNSLTLISVVTSFANVYYSTHEQMYYSMNIHFFMWILSRFNILLPN